MMRTPTGNNWRVLTSLIDTDVSDVRLVEKVDGEDGGTMGIAIVRIFPQHHLHHLEKDVNVPGLFKEKEAWGLVGLYTHVSAGQPLLSDALKAKKGDPVVYKKILEQLAMLLHQFVQNHIWVAKPLSCDDFVWTTDNQLVMWNRSKLVHDTFRTAGLSFDDLTTKLKLLSESVKPDENMLAYVEKIMNSIYGIAFVRYM